MPKLLQTRFEFDVPFWGVQKARDALNLLQGEVEVGIRKELITLEYEEDHHKVVFVTFTINLTYSNPDLDLSSIYNKIKSMLG